MRKGTEETDKYSIDCTGDVVVGDTIEFTEAVFGGSFRSPKYLGDRTIEANVIKDSYGDKKQQHTFSLVVISSTGIQPIASGKRTTRKGRNIYKNGTLRAEWTNEAERLDAADEKHSRGDFHRAAREDRKNGLNY